MPTHYYCPNCWKEINDKILTCPHCGHVLSQQQSFTYVEKLIHALRHPIPEKRMMAAQLLGDLRCKEALSVFAEILKKESDYYFIKEIILAIDKIGSEDGIAILLSLREHSSSLVKKLVDEILKEHHGRKQSSF